VSMKLLYGLYRLGTSKLLYGSLEFNQVIIFSLLRLMKVLTSLETEIFVFSSIVIYSYPEWKGILYLYEVN